MTILETGQTTGFSDQTNEGTEDSDDFVHVGPEGTDAPSSEGFTRWTPEHDKWNAFYRKIPEYRSIIDKFASWTFGRGIKANRANKIKLDKIKGCGKESGRVVLKSQYRKAMICGDSFAHILPGGNLKPLNAGKVTSVWDKFGIIFGYEIKGVDKIFQPEEIYHLMNERDGDEIHGIPFAEAIEKMLEARGEALQDLRILYHRTIKPIQFYEAETNDTAKLKSLEDTINSAYKKSENVVIKAGILKEIKRSGNPQFSNPDTGSLVYVKFLVRALVTACGMPEVVMGWGEQTTEASANIIYLAFQQDIEDKQLYNQEMVELQLGIIIDLEFPASIETMLQRDQKKDGPVKAEKPQAGKDT